MGNVFSYLFSSYLKKETKIVMVGLDAAGKTTVLYKLKLGEVVTTIPTIGFNVETIAYKNLSMTVWDICAQDKIRPLWRHYYPGCSGLIFIVDCRDRERFSEACDELMRVTGDLEDVEGARCDAPVLILANKQDLPQAMTVDDVRRGIISNNILKRNLERRKWHIEATIATDGTGLYEGLDWLAQNIK